ncbi:MAG: hypothetical protein L6R45_02405 [Anaerolineae bacterium]|nr:hypothetical protein [Anaerolineae bacterium]
MARLRIRGLSRPGPVSWLLALGLFLAGLGGAFLPWLWREPVALQLTAPGLAEFVKFLPQVRYNQVAVQRLFFLLPLFLSMLALPLLAENSQLALPRWLRWLLRLAVIPLALAGLSPVWTPAVLTAPEFRLQTLLAVSAVTLAVSAPLWRKLPLKPLLGLLLIGGLAALVLPWWHFSLIQPGLAEAYHQPVALGWGWWLTVSGIILSLSGAIFLHRVN